MQGDCNTSQPGIFDPKGRAKWSAWNGKKGRPGIVGAVGMLTCRSKNRVGRRLLRFEERAVVEEESSFCTASRRGTGEGQG